MSLNVNVTIPDHIAQYLQMRSKEEYLPMSAIVRRYVAKSVVEEMVIHYHKKGFSIAKTAELADTTIGNVMDVLRTLDEVSEDIDEDWDFIESGK